LPIRKEINTCKITHGLNSSSRGNYYKEIIEREQREAPRRKRCLPLKGGARVFKKPTFAESGMGGAPHKKKSFKLRLVSSEKNSLKGELKASILWGKKPQVGGKREKGRDCFEVFPRHGPGIS